MKIKKGDQVQIITGKDRGKRGEIVRVFPKAERVIVKGLNMMKRHMKAASGQPGERIEKEAPLHVSNVMVICKETDKPTRIGFTQKGEEKIRVSRRSGKAL